MGDEITGLIHDKTIHFETRSLTSDNIISVTSSPRVASAVTTTAGALVRMSEKGAKTLINLSNARGNTNWQDSKQNDLTVKSGTYLKKGLVVTKKTARASANAVKGTVKTVKRTVKTVKGTAKTVKGTVKAVKRTTKFVQRTVRTAQKAVKVAAKAAEATAKAAVATAKAITQALIAMLSNPFTAILLAVVMIIVLLVALFSGASNTSTKSLMGDELYSQLREYTAQKDAALLDKFNSYVPNGVEPENVDYVLNCTPATSFKLLATYLVAKHEGELNYDNGCASIDEIHSKLYTLSSKTHDDETATVTLDGTTLKAFFEAHIDEYLTDSQKSTYELLLLLEKIFSVGGFGPPFEDENYWNEVSQEFGVPSWGSGGTSPHMGTDFAYPKNTQVISVCAGTVTHVGDMGNAGLGRYVEVTSTDGTYFIRYGHFETQQVAVGDTVSIGDPIGLVGTTGNSSGYHLHLEIYENGTAINPREVLPE